MLKNRSNRLSTFAFACCIVIMAFTSLVYYPRWDKIGSEAQISCDVSGYYWYLPSIFIYHDIKGQKFANEIITKYQPSDDFQQGFLLPNGNYVLKYSSGMAVMYLPFFTAGHIAAGALGYPQDGFSKPYPLAIQLGALLVGIIGLWYLRKLMLRFYEDKVVAILLFVLVVGTNYLNSAVIDGGMSHNWLFTLYVFLLLNTVYFYETFKIKYAVRIGLLVGLATLTRPTDALSVLIPLLWGMESLSLKAIRQKAALILSQYRSLLVAAACAAAVASLQFIYWKGVSGNWIVYSYQDQHLDFLSPNFINYTFSFRTGWLLYTPMLVFAIIGLLPFWFKGKNKVAITAFFVLNYYVVCAWSIWWYGGRAMVQSYPVLMFPMASLIAFVIKRNVLRYICTPVALFFAYMNIWYTHQSHRGALYDTTTMNKAYYKRVAGRWTVPDNTIVLRDNAELYEGVPQSVHTIWKYKNIKDSSARNWQVIIYPLEKQTLEFRFAHASDNTQWLRFSADFYCEHREGEIWKMAQFVGRIYNKGVKQKETMLRIHRILNENRLQTITLDMHVENIQFDSVSVGFWNEFSEKQVMVNNMTVYGFNEK